MAEGKIPIPIDEEDEKEAQLRNAGELIKRGEEAAHQGKIKNAISMYLKAIELYLEAGKFLKVADSFNQMVAFVQSETQLLPLMEKLRNVISTVEQLDIPEEEAKLKLALAQVMFKSSDYLNAGNLFLEVADLFIKVEPEEYRQLSGMFLLRAAECYERISRNERGEKMVFEAIKRFDISNFDYKKQEAVFLKFIKKKDYLHAIDIIREIAAFFRRLETELQNLRDDTDVIKNLKRNVEARILHMVSEYNFLKMVCFRHLKDWEKLNAQIDKSIQDLIMAIDLLKEEINSGDYSLIDIKRLTYDVFMLQTFQEYGDHQTEDPIDLATRGLKPEVIEQLKGLKFYEYTTRILEIGLKDNLEWIQEMDLGPTLNEYREFLIESLKIPLPE